MELVQEQ